MAAERRDEMVKQKRYDDDDDRDFSPPQRQAAEEEQRQEELEEGEIPPEDQAPMEQSSEDDSGSVWSDIDFAILNDLLDELRSVLVSYRMKERESELRDCVQCPICLGIVKKARILVDCVHRFCGECIEKALRMGIHSCPVCRMHVPSRRSLRDDASFDCVVEAIYEDVEKYEAEELGLNTEERAPNEQTPKSISLSSIQQLIKLAKRIRLGRSSEASCSYQHAYSGLENNNQSTELQQSDHNESEDDHEQNAPTDECGKQTQVRRIIIGGAPPNQTSLPMSAINSKGKEVENSTEIIRDNPALKPVSGQETFSLGSGGAQGHSQHGNASSSKNASSNQLSDNPADYPIYLGSGSTQGYSQHGNASSSKIASSNQLSDNSDDSLIYLGFSGQGYYSQHGNASSSKIASSNQLSDNDSDDYPIYLGFSGQGYSQLIGNANSSKNASSNQLSDNPSDSTFSLESGSAQGHSHHGNASSNQLSDNPSDSTFSLGSGSAQGHSHHGNASSNQLSDNPSDSTFSLGSGSAQGHTHHGNANSSRNASSNQLSDNPADSHASLEPVSRHETFHLGSGGAQGHSQNGNASSNQLSNSVNSIPNGQINDDQEVVHILPSRLDRETLSMGERIMEGMVLPVVRTRMSDHSIEMQDTICSNIYRCIAPYLEVLYLLEEKERDLKKTRKEVEEKMQQLNDALHSTVEALKGDLNGCQNRLMEMESLRRELGEDAKVESLRDALSYVQSELGKLDWERKGIMEKEFEVLQVENSTLHDSQVIAGLIISRTGNAGVGGWKVWYKSPAEYERDLRDAVAVYYKIGKSAMKKKVRETILEVYPSFEPAQFNLDPSKDESAEGGGSLSHGLSSTTVAPGLVPGAEPSAGHTQTAPRPHHEDMEE